MYKVLNHPTNLIGRHFLLLNICEQLYKKRADPKMAAEYARIAEMHLAKFPRIVHALHAEFPRGLPRVPTFQTYATHLTNAGDYPRAIWVCELALFYGLYDGTDSGFKGRIERIKKKAGSSR